MVRKNCSDYKYFMMFEKQTVVGDCLNKKTLLKFRRDCNDQGIPNHFDWFISFLLINNSSYK